MWPGNSRCQFRQRLVVVSIGSFRRNGNRAGFDIISPRIYPFQMESLYAPWRIQYILAPKPAAGDSSIFTQIAQSSDDEANLVIARDRTCYALLNKYPYTAGHVMAVPYKETPDLHGLTDEELSDLMKLVRRCQD